MNLYRSLAAVGGAAVVAASSARAQQATSCNIDEGKPKEVATANFMITQARSLQGQRRTDALKKVVKALTEKNDPANAVGRSYELGKVFFTLLEDSTFAQQTTRGALGFTTDAAAPVDVAVLADSMMRVVETAMPECKSLTGTFRRHPATLPFLSSR